jgi:hypothetical protein
MRVGMRVDQTRHCDHAVCVEHFIGCGRGNIRFHRSDCIVLDKDVANASIVASRIEKPGTPDQQIFRHECGTFLQDQEVATVGGQAQEP